MPVRLIYDVLREAAKPLTTRELAERIIDAKSIPAIDDHQRMLIQKTMLGSLNRAKETIERSVTAGVGERGGGAGGRAGGPQQAKKTDGVSLVSPRAGR